MRVGLANYFSDAISNNAKRAYEISRVTRFGFY